MNPVQDAVCVCVPTDQCVDIQLVDVLWAGTLMECVTDVLLSAANASHAIQQSNILSHGSRVIVSVHTDGLMCKLSVFLRERWRESTREK